MDKEMQRRLQAVLDNAVDGKRVFGTSFCVKTEHFEWCGASGDFSVDQPYFIASTTKLFVTAVLLHYRHRGLLSLEDRIGKFLPKEVVSGLVVLGGTDLSAEITIRDLLAHTSGIPDYFQSKDATGQSLEAELIGGSDLHWTFDEAIGRSKRLKPRFRPGSAGKAHYSDTNFQLLGKIVETIAAEPIATVIEGVICHPLGLGRTYLYANAADTRPKALYYRAGRLHIPKGMVSFGPDGGIVSTSSELMVFLQAFFAGRLFPRAYLAELAVWNRIFFPMQSGVGIHRFRLPRIFDPFGRIPELVGHSGLSGALAFHGPAKGVFVTGTVNQVAYPDTSFRTMIKLVQRAIDKRR